MTMRLHLYLCVFLLLQCRAFVVKQDRRSSYQRSLVQVNAEKGNLPVAVDAMALKRQAEALRAEARAIQKNVTETKAERERKERERVDRWIDQLLVNVTVDDSTQLLNTEEQVAEILKEGRYSAEHVNKIFDRICEVSQRRQSIDDHSPLITLLLDAAHKLDCLERDENPNKRWNHRVERDLRKKLFALGWGIDIDGVKSRDQIRSITGEKDYL